MSRYFDDELYHSGVKGMKWKRHKYKLVKDANGKLHYVYDMMPKNKSNNQNMKREIHSKDEIPALDSWQPYAPAPHGNGHYAYTKEEQEFLDKEKAKEKAEKADIGEKAHKIVKYGGKFGPVMYVYDQATKAHKESQQKKKQHSARTSEASARAEAARKKQIRDKEQSARTSESFARASKNREDQLAKAARDEGRRKRQAQAEANKEQIERRKRIRRAEANKEQIERRKRIRQAEANEAQVERRKRIRQAEANADQIEARRKKRERESLEKTIKSAKERTAKQVARRKEHVLHENTLHENVLHENTLHENVLHENALHEKKPTVSGSNNVTYWENAHVTSWRKKRR